MSAEEAASSSTAAVAAAAAPVAATAAATSAAPAAASRPIPAGLTPYKEQSTTILLPDDNTAFLNPVQQFNRDLSVAVISTWGQVWREEGKAEWEAKLAKKASKGKGKGKGKAPAPTAAAAAVEEPSAAPAVQAAPETTMSEGAEAVVAGNAEVRLRCLPACSDEALPPRRV